MSMLCVLALALTATPSQGATILYDSGKTGQSLSHVGMSGAVRFTNPSTNHFMDVQNVLISGNDIVAGSLDVYLWEASTGQPGTSLASITGTSLTSAAWNQYDFSGAGISVAPGDDIFAGFTAGDADLQYDDDDTTTHRSWWRFSSTTSWYQGMIGNGDQDLMVRLEYEPGELLPEPTSLLLLIGATLLTLQLRPCRT
jgi:hypothetical protein